MDSVFRALWLATQPPDIQCYSLILLQLLRRQTRVSYEHNSFPVLYCRNKQRNLQILTNNQAAVTEIHEEGDEIRFGSLTRWSFDLNSSMKPLKKFFVMQIQSCVSLFTSCHVHKKRLKTTFNRFLQNGFKHKKNHDCFWRNFPARKSLTNAMPSKILFVCQKTRRPFGHCAQLSHCFSVY